MSGGNNYSSPNRFITLHGLNFGVNQFTLRIIEPGMGQGLKIWVGK